jgi:hypothetical protein
MTEASATGRRLSGAVECRPSCAAGRRLSGAVERRPSYVAQGPLWEAAQCRPCATERPLLGLVFQWPPPGATRRRSVRAVERRPSNGPALRSGLVQYHISRHPPSTIAAARKSCGGAQEVNRRPGSGTDVDEAKVRALAL